MITRISTTIYRQEVPIRKYWFHKNTNYDDKDNTGGVWVYDIALLKLDYMIKDFIPICLPNINEDYSNRRKITIFGM